MAGNSLRPASHLIDGAAFSLMISHRSGGVHVVRSHPLRTAIVLDIHRMGFDHPDTFKFSSKFLVMNGTADTPAGSDPGPSAHQSSMSPYGKALCVLFLECSSLQKEELEVQFKKLFQCNRFDLAIFLGRNKCLNDLRTLFNELKFNALSETCDGSLYATWRASISVGSWKVSRSAMTLKVMAPDSESCPHAPVATSSTAGAKPQPFIRQKPCLVSETTYDGQSERPTFLYLAVFKPIGAKPGAYAGIFTNMISKWIQGFYGYVNEVSEVGLALRGLDCGIDIIRDNDWTNVIIHAVRLDVVKLVANKIIADRHMYPTLEVVGQVGFLSKKYGCFITCIPPEEHPMAAKLAQYSYEKRVTSAMLVNPPPDL